MFTFGIEHEVAFFAPDGQFSDYCHPLSFPAFSAMIDRLPKYAGDYPQLIIGDAGIRVKRWYLEGLERFDASGQLLTCLSKGIEIRTTLHSTIQSAIQELTQSFQMLCTEALADGFTPVLTSLNPYRTEFVPDPPFNPYEEALLNLSPEDRSALLSMLTYGPDLSISVQDLSTEAILDLGRKYTFYSPFLVPFTFSSPFYDGVLQPDMLSMRTYLRTGLRPSVLVFLEHAAEMQESNPSLTKRARVPAEVGRIEFKACDSCEDFRLYAALLAVLKGLALDTSLTGRSQTPERALHQRAARKGFFDAELAAEAEKVLSAASHALEGDPDALLLAPLFALLRNYAPLSSRLIAAYQAHPSVAETLRQTYQF